MRHEQPKNIATPERRRLTDSRGSPVSARLLTGRATKTDPAQSRGQSGADGDANTAKTGVVKTVHKSPSLQAEKLELAKERLRLDQKMLVLDTANLALERERLAFERESARVTNLVELLKLRRMPWSRADTKQIEAEIERLSI